MSVKLDIKCDWCGKGIYDGEIVCCNSCKTDDEKLISDLEHKIRELEDRITNLEIDINALGGES